MTKPKILLFTSSFPRWQGDTGGHFILALAAQMTSNFEVFVLTPHFSGAKTIEIVEDITIFRFRYFFEKLEIIAGKTGILPTIRKNRWLLLILPFFLLGGLISLFKITLRLKPRIIHAHWTIPQGLQATVISKLTKTPFMVTAHGTDILGLSRGLGKLLNSFVIINASAITVVSNYLLKVLTDKYQFHTRPFVIPMGVNVTDYLSPSRSVLRRKLLFVGRLSAQKGLSYLLEALPAIIKAYPDTSLTVVGGGEQEEELKELTTRLEIQKNVRFVGMVPPKSLAYFYSNADVFIGPSVKVDSGDTEGFGLTFVEASISGCLVIGTDVGGIPDILTDGETGIILPSRNSAAIARAVIQIFSHWKQFEHIAINGKSNCIEKFGWITIGKKYQHLIEDTISCQNHYK